MGFKRSRHGVVTPYFRAKKENSADEFDPNEVFVWQPVLGPADSSGPSAPNPMSPLQPDPMPSLLAFTLNWNVPRARK